MSAPTVDRIDVDMMRTAVRDAANVYAGEPGHVVTLEHADGARTVVVYDDDSEHANPREYDGNVSTLVQLNPRCIDVDDVDDYGIAEAVERWGRDDIRTARYLAMFRPDILHYDPHWTAGDSYGFGFVTRDAWRAAMGDDYAGEHTPAEAFRSEVDVYGQWARGEVYGAHYLTAGAPVVAYGAHGAYVDGYAVAEDSVWGFLGYDDEADIAARV